MFFFPERDNNRKTYHRGTALVLSRVRRATGEGIARVESSGADVMSSSRLLVIVRQSPQAGGGSVVLVVVVVVLVFHAVFVGVGARTAHDRAANRADPVVLLLLRVGVHEVGRVGRRDLERVPFVRLVLRRFDRHTRREVDHAVGRRHLALGEEQLRALENEVPPPPVLQPDRLLGEPALVVGRTGVVANARRGIDIGASTHRVLLGGVVEPLPLRGRE
mmetsp:Transcript_6684/g.28043  ORF Transcript_6684/g.28043 Transcript_6684/m.28043 type:complete len:219 (+) Transcript_6684:194-850(+)